MNRNSPGSPPTEPGGVKDDSPASARTDRWLPFLVADALYLLILFGWTLRLGPMGEDFVRLPEASAGKGGWFFTVCSGMFHGPSVVWPRLASLVLLYGVVVLVFRLSRSITGGPWWLGSVAAVLFLAHPVKSGAIFTVTGITALADGLLLLVAVWVVESSARGGVGRTLAGWLLPPGIAWITGQWWTALVLIAGWAWIRQSTGWGGMRRVLPVTLAILGGALYSCSWDPMGLFGLLRGGQAWLLVAWPFGLSADAARFFEAYPAWHAAWSLITWAGLILLARHFAGRAAGRLVALSLPVCLAVGGRLDVQTFEGGGAYMVPVALLALVGAAGFRAQLEHPRFRKRTVAASTATCLALMAWHGWISMDWQRAHRLLKQGMAQAATIPGDETLAVFPDVYRVGFAPVRLAEALRCPPPFGPGRDASALVWVEMTPGLTRVVDVPEYGPGGGTLRIVDVVGAHPWTGYRLEPLPERPSGPQMLKRILMPQRPRVASAPAEWRITPWREPFPARRVAFP